MARKQKKYHYLYKTTNEINGKFYIGIHSTDNLNDGYIGSGKRLWYSLNKYGKENHKKDILEFVNSREILHQKEIDLINEYKNSNLCMNLSNGGFGFNMNHTIETKAKISETLSNKTYEDIHGVSNANKEREKRRKAALNQWKTIDENAKKEMSNKIAQTLKNYFKEHPEAKLQKKYKCPHCEKEGGNTMFRWHFDNCKNK
jgi:hypothetical protein